MRYSIKGTDIQLSPELNEYLEKRLVNADKFVQGHKPVLLSVVLEYESGAAGPKYRADLTCTRGKDTLRAEARGASLHEAIDIAVHELTTELSRARDKRRRLFRTGAAKLKGLFRRDGGEGEEI